MINELRQAIYTYLTTSNDFITLLGDNFYHKRPLNDKDYPFCFFDEVSQDRSIDSGDKFIHSRIEFRIYDGSNDAVPESTVSPDNVEDLVKELDTMLDNKQNSITISNYNFVRIKLNNIIELPTESNAVFGVRLLYDATLQITR